MKRSLLHILRVVVTSPETLCALIVLLVFSIWPGPFEWCHEAGRGYSWWYMLGPLGVMQALALKWGVQVLFPPKRAAVLAKFPQYPEMRLTVLIGIAYVAVGAFIAVIGVLGSKVMELGVPVLLVCIGFGVAALSTFSMFGAALTVRSFLLGGE